MSLKIKREYSIDYIVWFLLLFYVLIAHWIWRGRGIQEDLIIVFSIVGVTKSIKMEKIRRSALPAYVGGIVLFLICFIGILVNHSYTYLAEDTKAMIGTFGVGMYILVCGYKKTEAIEKTKIFLFKFLNIYAVINSMIIIIQYFIPYFLVNRSAMVRVNNNYYTDQITGFFGVNGTTRWCVWTMVIIILNFHMYYRKKRRLFLAYNITLIFISTLISFMNSCRSFVVFLPMTLLIYFFVIRKVGIRIRIKYVWFMMLFALFCISIYALNSYVKNYIDELIQDKIMTYLSADIEFMISSNDDRVIATNYAYKNGGLWGTGIGSIPMHSSNNIVKYLGLNSASSYIHMVGVSGYFLYCFILARMGAVLCRGKIGQNWTITIVYFVFLVIISYLLPIFSSIALLGGIALLFRIFGLERS